MRYNNNDGLQPARCTASGPCPPNLARVAPQGWKLSHAEPVPLVFPPCGSEMRLIAVITDIGPVPVVLGGTLMRTPIVRILAASMRKTGTAFPSPPDHRFPFFLRAHPAGGLQRSVICLPFLERSLADGRAAAHRGAVA